MNNRLTNGVYAAMKFPPYKFAEFPKAITIEGSPKKGRGPLQVIVNNLREELQVRADKPVIDSPKDPMVEERDELARKANEFAATIQALKDEIEGLKAKKIVDNGPKVITDKK